MPVCLTNKSDTYIYIMDHCTYEMAYKSIYIYSTDVQPRLDTKLGAVLPEVWLGPTRG